jgi:hypothetical protein
MWGREVTLDEEAKETTSAPQSYQDCVDAINQGYRTVVDPFFQPDNETAVALLSLALQMWQSRD